MVSKTWRPPIPLDGHIFSFGRTGSGKSWKLLALLQFYHARGYKIWDLFGGKRKEGPFWCFPSDEQKLWFDYTKEVGELKHPGPKEYDVDLFIPFFFNSLPDKVPEMLPRITSNLFTLDFKDIEPEDIAIVTGTLTKPQQNIWNKLRKQLPANSTGEDILHWFKKDKFAKKTPLYYDFVEPFVEAKILTGSNSPLKLNLKEEAFKKDRIFVLLEEYTPLKYRMFFINFIASRLFDLVNNNKIHTQNLCFYREMNMFMKVQDASTEDAEQKQLLRNRISDIARYGRSGLFMAGDSQSPAEVRGLIEGQDDLTCLNELPGLRDREEACERFRVEGRMSTKQIAYLGVMPVEQMAVVERRKPARLLQRVQPPRTMGWKRQTGNFLKVWTSKYNKWRNINEEKDKIKMLYKQSKLMIDAKQDIDDKVEHATYDESKEEDIDESSENIEIVKIKPNKYINKPEEVKDTKNKMTKEDIEALRKQIEEEEIIV